MSDVPPAALAAAMKLAQDKGIVWVTEETLELLLGAAAPAIRADEREQDAKLAEREAARMRAANFSTADAIGAGALEDFADLIRERGTDGD